MVRDQEMDELGAGRRGGGGIWYRQGSRLGEEAGKIGIYLIR